MAICKGPRCGAEILWVNSRKYVTEGGHHRGGKGVPLDPEPNSAGNVVLEPGDDGKPVAVVLANDAAERYTGDKYMPHWKTCPDRDMFRKKKPSKAVALPLIFLLGGCALNQSELTQWTRHWEAEMALPEAPVEFVEQLDGFCGQVVPLMAVPEGFDPLEVHTAVLVRFKTGGLCGLTNEHDLALHEACHRRMMHHQVDLSEDRRENRRLKEAEVKECSLWYRTRRKR